MKKESMETKSVKDTHIITKSVGKEYVTKIRISSAMYPGFLPSDVTPDIF